MLLFPLETMSHQYLIFPFELEYYKMVPLQHRGDVVEAGKLCMATKGPAAPPRGQSSVY